MLSLKNKIVLITGASSGIGKACAEHFAAQGARLILTARRLDRITDLAEQLKTQHGIDALPIELDVQNKEKVLQMLQTLPTNWQAIDVLINNAGLALDSVKIQDGNLEHWDTMISTNINGLLYVTHTLLPGMIARNRGHVINIGSTAGFQSYPTGNVYSATKHAVRGISRAMRIDLLGTAIRVTEIDPGMVHTEFSEVRWNNKEKSDQFYAGLTPLTADDIADAVLFCATRPLHVDIAELVIYPTDQASANHVHKKGQEVKGVFD